MAQGIDFMAIARGRQQALDDNFKDIVRLQQQEQFAFEREKRAAEREQNQINRIATTYTAPWMLNMQQLTKQGLSEVDAYLQGLSLIQNDAGFQALPPEAQSKVLEQVQGFAVPITQRLAAAGDVAGIQKLSSGLGVTNPVSALDAAINSGDPTAIITAAGYKVEPGAQTVDVGGQQVPVSMLAVRIAQTRNRAGALEAAEQTRIDAQTRGQVDAQRLSRIAEIEAQYVVGAGFIKQPDGTLLQPSTGNRIRINEQGAAVLVPPPVVPGATGQVGLNTVLRDPNVPVPETPEAAAVTQAAGGGLPINPMTILNTLNPAAAAGTAIGRLIQQNTGGDFRTGMVDQFENTANAVRAAAQFGNQVIGGAAAKLDAMQAGAPTPAVPPAISSFVRMQTANDIIAGQSDVSAAVYARRSPEQRRAILIRLQDALNSPQYANDRAKILAAIERFRKVK
jgi:hypothetical protein